MAVLSTVRQNATDRYGTIILVQYDITTCSSQVQYRTSSTYFILGTCMNARIANLHDNARSAPVIYLSIYQYPAVKITAVTQNVVSTQLSHVYVVASSSIHTSSIFGTYLIDLLIPSWYMQYSNSCMYRPDRQADRIDYLYSTTLVHVRSWYLEVQYEYRTDNSTHFNYCSKFLGHACMRAAKICMIARAAPRKFVPFSRKGRSAFPIFRSPNFLLCSP